MRARRSASTVSWLVVMLVACGGGDRPTTQPRENLPATAGDAGASTDGGAAPAHAPDAGPKTPSEDAGDDDEPLACAGCLVEEHCFLRGEKLPLDPCRVCDPDRSTSSLSDDDGQACDDGDACTEQDRCRAGSCAGEAKSCSDGVACNGEESCSAESGACQAGVPSCASNLHCNLERDACEPTCFGCLIAGVCYADGALHPSDPCLTCDVARESERWSAREGASCAEPGECHDGGTCNAQGECELRAEPRGTSCSDGADPCQSWACDGEGACTLSKSASDQPCGSVGPCQVQGFCDGAGSCAGSGVRELGAACEEHGVCSGEADAPVCTCAKGFERVGEACVDIDECARGLDGCDGAPDACVNQEGGYACACPEGYEGKGEGARGCSCERADYSPLCKPYSEVDFKYNHACAISEGALFCWGPGYYGELGSTPKGPRLMPTRVGDASDWQHVSVGRYHSCGLRGGAVYCWGQDSYGSLGLGGDSSDVPRQVGSDGDWFALGVGEYTSCGLRAHGELWCWGDLVNSKVPKHLAAESDGYEQLSFGHGKHGCLLKAGALSCWGDNYYGAVGDGTNTTRAEPVPVGEPSGWLSVSAGHERTCALREGGALFCWGNGNLGRAPKLVEGFSDWATITAGYYAQCGLRDGKAYCWGSNALIGDGGLKPRTTPTELALQGGWQSFAVGDAGMCGIRDGGLYCWGNVWGLTQLRPARVDALDDYLHVGTGDFHTCAVRRGGELMCWGSGQSNPLAAQEKPWTPRRVGEDADWTSVVGSYTHACGLRGAGQLYCWGSNDSYQLGVGWSVGSATLPLRVGDGEDWRSVSLASTQSCGLRGAQGDLYCWGNGAGSGRYTPALINGLSTGYSQASAGGYYGCGVRDGQGLCWGSDHAGALGIGLVSSSDVYKPTVIGPPAEFVQVQARYRNSCGIDAAGQLGTGGPAENATTPVPVASSERFAQVSVGDGRSCAVSQDGRVYCWGNNVFGMLGVGDGNPRPTPAQLDLEGWSEVSVSANHACGIRAGELLCWGSNTYGQLGTGWGIVPTPLAQANDLE